MKNLLSSVLTLTVLLAMSPVGSAGGLLQVRTSVRALGRAVSEAREQRDLRAILKALGLIAGATLICLLLLKALNFYTRRLHGRLAERLRRHIASLPSWSGCSRWRWHIPICPAH